MRFNARIHSEIIASPIGPSAPAVLSRLIALLTHIGEAPLRFHRIRVI